MMNRFVLPLVFLLVGTGSAFAQAPVTRIQGEIALEAHDTVWSLTPVAPWQTGEYNLVAQPFLEDPQGNQIGRAFEVFANELKDDRAPGSAGKPEADLAYRVRFTVGAP